MAVPCAAWFERDKDNRIVDKRKWCVMSRGRKKYADHIQTLCGNTITFAVGVEVREPTCIECLAKIRRRR